MEYTVRIGIERTGRRADPAVLITYDFGPDAPKGPRTATAAVPESALAAVLRHADAAYYVDDPTEDEPAQAERLRRLGMELYDVLDTPQGWLSGFLRDRRAVTWTLVVLALEVAEGLGHLPWELLHDGISYLVGSARPVVPVRVVSSVPAASAPAPRPLRVLFMACAPADGAHTLDYQAEAAMIEGAAVDDGLPLVFEYMPTGSLEQLELWLRQEKEDDYDVLHITGHATRSASGAVFVTETVSGGSVASGAQDFADALYASQPRLIVLSGCRTAESGDLGSAPSLAQELAGISAPTVIGWGRPVDDEVATQATAALYQWLMSGRSPARAMNHAYRRLIRAGRPQWHCLRMFVQGEPPGPLVTARAEMDQDKINLNRARLVMPYGLQRVDRRGFVGRRAEIRALWNCLNPHADSPRPGAIVHGVGGIGKTTLVAHVLDLLQDHVDFVPIDRRLDSETLLAAMRSTHPVLANALGSVRSDEALDVLLTRALDQVDRPLVFVLDEFERNIRDGVADALLSHGAAQALSALITALLRSRRRHRLVVTSRYRPLLPEIDRLTDVPLSPLDGTSLKFKINRLRAEARLDESTVQTIMDVARENTWLLDSLFAIARDNPGMSTDLLRSRLRERRAEFYATPDGATHGGDRHLLVDELVGRQDSGSARLLELMALIRIPVGLGLLTRLSGPAALVAAERTLEPARRETAERADRLARWHLLEQGETPDGQAVYRVPTLLEPHLLGGNGPAGPARCARALAAELRVHDDVLDPDLLDLTALNELYRLAVAGGERGLVVRSSVVLAEAAAERYRYTEAAEICRRAIDIAPHPLLFARLGNVLAEQGDSTAARAAFATALDDVSGLTDREHARVLATIAFWAGFYSPETQTDLLERALVLARAAGDVLTEADCLRLVAGGTARSRQWERARELYDESLELMRSLPDSRRAQDVVIIERASMEIDAQNAAAALADLKELLARYRKPGSELREAAVRIRMSHAHLLDLDFDGAQAEAQHSRELAVAIGWIRAEFDALAQLSAVEMQRYYRTAAPQDATHLHRATAFMEEGRGLADAIGWPILRRGALQSLASLYRLARRDDDADRLETALRAAEGEEAESPPERADRLMLTAEIRRDDGRPEEAVALAQEALSLLTPEGTESQEARARRVLAQVGDERETGAAELDTHLRRLLELYPSVDPASLPLVHIWRARMFLREEQPQRALPHLVRSAAGFEAEGDPASQATVHELWSGLPGIDAEERSRHLRTAARLRWDARDLSSTAAVLRELASGEPAAARERTLRAGLLLAHAAGAHGVEGRILIDLADLLPATAPERERMRKDGTLTRRRGEPFHLIVGTRLSTLLEGSNNGGVLLTELAERRLTLKESHGITLPVVATSDDDTVGRDDYTVYLWGEPMASGRFPAHAAPTRGKMARFVSERLFGPAAPAEAAAPEPTPTDAARALVSAVIDVALAQRDRLAEPPQAGPTTPLTPQEEQFVTEVIRDDA
jgi:tetratricopeptide (TPR) repeat protein